MQLDLFVSHTADTLQSGLYVIITAGTLQSGLYVILTADTLSGCVKEVSSKEVGVKEHSYV